MPGLLGIARNATSRTTRIVGERGGEMLHGWAKKRYMIPCADLKGNPDALLIILRWRISDLSGQERGTTQN